MGDSDGDSDTSDTQISRQGDAQVTGRSDCLVTGGPPAPLAVSFTEVGRLIGRSSRTIRRMVDRGEVVRIEGHALILYASLEAWIQARTSEAIGIGR